jgi:hypothetical protein
MIEAYLRSSEKLPICNGGGGGGGEWIVNYAHINSQSNLKLIFSFFKHLSVADPF